MSVLVEKTSLNTVVPGEASDEASKDTKARRLCLRHVGFFCDVLTIAGE